MLYISDTDLWTVRICSVSKCRINIIWMLIIFYQWLYYINGAANLAGLRLYCSVSHNHPSTASDLRCHCVILTAGFSRGSYSTEKQQQCSLLLVGTCFPVFNINNVYFSAGLDSTVSLKDWEMIKIKNIFKIFKI